jgi:cell division protein FtsI (penicillin-binding protein 3)
VIVANAAGLPTGSKRAPLGRLGWFTVLLALAAGAIMVRYTTLMAGGPDQPLGGEIRLPSVERGPILDRNGRVLAITTNLDSVTAWLPAVSDLPAVVARLAEILQLDSQQIAARLGRGTDFVFVQRQITPTQAALVEEARRGGLLPGISLQPEHGRSYPEQTLAAHALGFVGVDNIGLDGIENTFNHVLAPPTIEPNVREVYGNQVMLTLDLNVQYAMEQLAAKALAEHRADRVFLLTVAARTGEILAYVAQPTFDPNTYGAFDEEERRNAISSFAYEPGSVFKAFTVAAMLDAGAIDLQTVLPSPGFYERRLNDGTTIRIDDLGAYGTVDAQQILQYSSNAGAAYASDRISSTAFFRELTELGFGAPTGMPFPGESAGILRAPGTWSSRSKATIAIGQELSVTALQIVAAATAIANDGLLLQPQLVNRVISPQGEVVKAFAPEPVREALAPAVARSVLRMMETATADGGTARRARVPGYRISAKTGTAQVVDPVSGRYFEDEVTASVLGIFPTEDPQFIVYIVLHNPRGEQRYGGVIASPILKQAAEYLFRHYRIPPADAATILQPASIEVPLPPKIVLDGLMPDLRGVAARRLQPLLSVPGLRFELQGAGFVARQLPAAGTPLVAGATVSLWLN